MAARKSFNSFCVSLGNVAMYSSMEANFDLVVSMKLLYALAHSWSNFSALISECNTDHYFSDVDFDSASAFEVRFSTRSGANSFFVFSCSRKTRADKSMTRNTARKTIEKRRSSTELKTGLSKNCTLIETIPLTGRIKPSTSKPPSRFMNKIQKANSLPVVLSFNKFHPADKTKAPLKIRVKFIDLPAPKRGEKNLQICTSPVHIMITDIE